MGLEWLAGVALSVVGNVLINLGTNIMKLGHNKQLQPHTPGAAHRDRAWQVGLALYSGGNLASFFSFGYAAQSILAVIGCTQFVSNIVFAALVLKERVTQLVLVATALIVAGCVLLVVFGSHSSDTLSISALQELYTRPAYIAYLIIGGAVVAATYTVHWLGRRALAAQQRKHTRCWIAVLPVLYSIFSALICTQSLIFNKTVMVLWRLTLAGDNQFNRWFTWLMAVGFIVTAGLWVVQLNKGLQLFPALVIVPCLQLCWTLFGVISGMLYFQEYVSMTGLQRAMFVLGVGVVCLGAVLLAAVSVAHGTATGQHEHAEEASQLPASLLPLAPQLSLRLPVAAGAGKATEALDGQPHTPHSPDWRVQVVLWGEDAAAKPAGDAALCAHDPLPSSLPVSNSSSSSSDGRLLEGPAPPGGPPRAAQGGWQGVCVPLHSVSLDSGGHPARRQARRVSRLRTCSMPS